MLNTEPAPAERTFSEQLRADVEPTWQAAITHRFVAGLFAGTLERDVLRRYLVQDYQFVDRFVALLGAAAASADTIAARMVLARQLGVVGGSENTYFQRAFDALEVPSAERESPEESAPTTAFQALMDEARASLDYPRCLAVLTVAEWLYWDWARRAPDQLPQDFVCREWIELHNGPDFGAWVGWLRGELDRVGPFLSEVDQRACRDAFARAVALELDFFEAAFG